MNKMKKLLSVVLAVVLAFSCFSILGSAAIAKVKSVDDLKTNDAYSPYGQVTRLSTEERASMVQDFLDVILPGLGINMGTVGLAGIIEVTLDLSSVDQLCVSIDSIKSVKGGILFGIAALIVDLGILEDLNLDSWNTGIDRAGDSQLTLFSELFELLSANSGIVNTVLTSGLDLGILGSLLGGLDLSSINELVTNLPKLVKGLVYPMIERWDDDLATIKNYDNSIDSESISIEGILNTRIKKLFSDNMSITTVKYDVNGKMTSEHTGMPILTSAPADPSNDSPRCVYVVTGTTPGSTMTVYHIVDKAEAEALAEDSDPDNNVAAYKYILQEGNYVLEEEVVGNGVYVWKAKDENNEVTSTLKYYNDESPFLPGFDGDDIDLTTMSAGELLYKFIPVVFENMAPVVLNGSVKKLLAEFVGVKFNYVGKAMSDEVLALGTDPIFAAEQGEYLWEWSDYAVIDGAHYYRYLDDVYAGDLSAVNNYFDIINWKYEVTDDFMDEFVPTSDDDASKRLLLNLSDFLAKVGNLVLLPSAETDDTASDYTATWTRPTFAAGNENLVSNIKALAQAVVGLAPQHIFGDDWRTNPRCYANLMLAGLKDQEGNPYVASEYTTTVEATNDVILVGIAATIVDLVMPSMTLPSQEEILTSGAKVGAILAVAIREFAAYLTPEYNYDALIYTDFGTTEGDPVKSFVSGKDSGYWLDVCLTMGINVGFEYLRAFADMGEGTDVWNSFVTNSGYGVDGKTYTEADLKLNADVKHWEMMLDYIIDWALSTDYEWTWNMKNLVNVTNLTIDLATAQDPWVKLQTVLGSILPVDEILTVEPASGQTKIEHFLRDDLILGIVDLKWDHLINTIQFNGTNKYFRGGNVLDNLALLLKGIVNSIFVKIGGGSYNFIPASVNDFDGLATQASLRTLAVDLVAKLKTAYDNGLLVTALPLLNMFLGWKTSPQERAEPVITETFQNNKDFAYQSSTTISGTAIHFLNNSAGMLETHRNSDIVDKDYAIQIVDVTSDATVNKLTFNYGDGHASPYETIDINIGGTYNGEEAATITIAYEYIGKDGNGIGGTQYTSRTIFFSNQAEDADVMVAETTSSSVTRKAYNKYIFTEDIYSTIENTSSSVGYEGSSDKDVQDYQAPAIKSTGEYIGPGADGCEGTSDDEYSGTVYHDYPSHDQYAKTYFGYRTQAESGWSKIDVTAVVATTGASGGKFFKGLSQYGPDYDYPLGVYAPQKVLVVYNNVQCIYDYTFIHYDDYGIYELYTANKENGYNAKQGVASAVYNEYNEAWKEVVRLATYPLMTTLNGHSTTDYLSVIAPQIEPAMERFEAAKEAYEEALADAQAAGAADSSLPEYVQALKDAIDDDYIEGDAINGGKEIDFQDVEFYEYFNYNDIKVKGEELYRTYLAPEIMDTYYIQGSGIREAELNDVIAAESNPFIAAGITASRQENDKAAVDASIAAKNEWKQPVNTKLYVEDVTSLINFYEQFAVLEANREGNEHLYFLEKEIAHIDAQQLKAEDYEAVTWGRFEEAYNKAVAVANGTADYADYNSTIYSAKYELMVKYKELMLKADSLIDAGGTAELNANIAIANEIFASLEAGDGAWVLKEGVDADKAYAALISALGYYYIGEDGYQYNLYADSALEYSDNDRPNKSGNQTKVNTANAALVTAIENFEEVVTVVEYTVTYTDGADGEVFADETYTVEEGAATPDFQGSTDREGYEFLGWTPQIADTVTGNVTYTAMWEEIIPEEPNTLMIKEDAIVEAFIDTQYEGEYTGYIYGIDTMASMTEDGTLADNLTTVLGDEYLVITEADGGETTGAIIEVLDADGETVLETYVFVYFGDIDMDGMITSTDGFFAEYYEANGEGLDGLHQAIAGDVDSDGMLTSTDGFFMEYFEANGEGIATQQELAEASIGMYYEM